MKKTAILLAMMLVVISVAFTATGCGCSSEGATEATEAPTATPIATAPPTSAATKAPTEAVTQAPTEGATTAPTEAATFEAQIATDATLPSSVPRATEAGSNSAEGPTASADASSSLGAPDSNGNYSVTGTVVGYGPNTVIVLLGDGNQYEFNYNSTGYSSSDLYDGATVSIVSDGDPSGAGVPNAVSMTIS